MRGDLAGPRGPAQVLAELGDGLVEGGLQLPEPPRNSDDVEPVAEVAQHLAVDGRHREGQEIVAAAGLEAVDRQDEADGGDLLEVVEVVAATIGVLAAMCRATGP